MDSMKSQAILTETQAKGHETRDVNLRLIVTSLVGLTLLIGVALLAVWLMFSFLANRENSRAVPLSPLTESQQPPEPRLQASPLQELQAIQAEEDAILHGPSSWINREAGIVRIPIERAIELTLERGLPTRPQEE